MPPKGKCHICKDLREVVYCSRCAHWFCEECRGKYWERGFAAVMELVGGRHPGCCGLGVSENG